MELTLNRSLLDSKSILFKSSFFYRGYNGDTTAEDISLIDDFDFNRDFTLDKLFLEFNKLDNDSIVSVGVGRTEIDQFSPLYKVDGIAVPEALQQQMKKAQDPLKYGVSQAKEMLCLAKTIFSGACIMPPFDRYEILKDIL